VTSGTLEKKESQLNEREKQLDTLQQRYDHMKEENAILKKEVKEMEMALSLTRDKMNKNELRKVADRRIDHSTIERLNNQVEELKH